MPQASKQLPDAPEPQQPPLYGTIPSEPEQKFIPPQFPVNRPDRFGQALTLGDMLTRGLDAYSTRRMLDRGNKELVLPHALADSKWGMPLYSEGIAGLTALGQHELVRHGHPKLGHLLTMGNIGYDLPLGINNMMLPNRNKPVTRIPKPPVGR